MEFDKRAKRIGAGAVAGVAILSALVLHDRQTKPDSSDGIDNTLAHEFKDLVKLQRSYPMSSKLLAPNPILMPPPPTPIPPPPISIQERFMQIIEGLKHGKSGLK